MNHSAQPGTWCTEIVWIIRNLFPATLLLWSLAKPALAQTPCPGSESCTGVVAQLVCPTPGTTLSGNDVTFTWCNANADYFLQIESVPGAHDIFYALVSAQNFVHLINLPTNGVTIYVALWTQVHGQWQQPLNYTFLTTNSLPPRLLSPLFDKTGDFQFTVEGLTPGRTNFIQNSRDLFNWSSINTNVAQGSILQVRIPVTGFDNHFYRVIEVR